MNMKVKSVGEFCKRYRRYLLELSLKDMEKLTGVKISTISSFENGRSTNLEHLQLYLNLSNEQQKEYFRKHIPFNL